MSKPRIIAIWQECDIQIAESASDETWPAGANAFSSVGVIKEKTTTLEATEGETLELKSTGGHTVDIVETEGSLQLKTTTIEPTSLYKLLGLTDSELTDTVEQGIKTHVVDKRFAVKLTPKRVGGIGYKFPVTQVSIKPGGSEEEGGSAEITFNVIKPADESVAWYTRFKKAAAAGGAG